MDQSDVISRRKSILIFTVFSVTGVILLVAKCDTVGGC